MKIDVELPVKMGELFEPIYHPVSGKRIRYRGAYGGRGSGKTQGFGKKAVIDQLENPHTFLCCRELQNSIKDSVHSVIAEQIFTLGAYEAFEVGESFIRRKGLPDGVVGQFLFKGLRSNAAEIKSMNRIKRCWVEEAQATSQKSLDYLLPTIREPESEIYFSWNPDDELDPVHSMLVTNCPENALVVKINYSDNPFFPDVLEEERLRTLKYQPDRYDWIWEGNFNSNAEGAVYGKWINAMQNAGRMIEGIYDPSLPVYTAWDLGYSDDTAIWWFQIVGLEVRLIDYYENNREDIKHYIEQLFGREIVVEQYGNHGKVVKWKHGGTIPGAEHRQKYKYAKHFVPHDAANKLLQAGGRSIIQQGHEFGVLMHVVAASSQQNQIQAARTTLDKCWADPVRCKDGLRALRKYAFVYDEDRAKWSDKPDHNGYSHGADAFEIIAQVWKSDIMAEEKKKPRFLEDMTVNELFYPKNSGSKGYDRI